MVLDISGINWLDLLFGRLFGNIDIRRKILSFENIFSLSIDTRSLAAKLF